MNDDHPTFLYAMPLTETKIFFEETSLVERPGLEFDDLKVKLQQRLDSLGIKVKSVSEEEYCLIPMGGVLPTLPQRTLGWRDSRDGAPLHRVHGVQDALRPRSWTRWRTRSRARRRWTRTRWRSVAQQARRG